MPARDFYHDAVKNALTKDGWTITHDPLTLRWGERTCSSTWERKNSWLPRRVITGSP